MGIKSGAATYTYWIKDGRVATESGNLHIFQEAGLLTIIDRERRTYSRMTPEEWRKASTAAQDLPPGAQELADAFRAKPAVRRTGRTKPIQGIAATETEILIAPDLAGAENEALKGTTFRVSLWSPTSAALGKVPALKTPLPGPLSPAANLPFGLQSVIEDITRSRPIILEMHSSVTVPSVSPKTPVFELTWTLTSYSIAPIPATTFEVPPGYNLVR